MANSLRPHYIAIVILLLPVFLKLYPWGRVVDVRWPAPCPHEEGYPALQPSPANQTGRSCHFDAAQSYDCTPLFDWPAECQEQLPREHKAGPCTQRLAQWADTQANTPNKVQHPTPLDPPKPQHDSKHP